MNAILGTVPKLAEAALTFAVQYSFRVEGGPVILFAGYAMRFGQQREIDITLTKFLAGCARCAIVGLAIIAALNNFGITFAPMIAAIGVAAFGATMATCARIRLPSPAEAASARVETSGIITPGKLERRRKRTWQRNY